MACQDKESGYQYKWYKQRIGSSLSYGTKDSIYLCRVSVVECYKLQYIFYVSYEKFSM